MNEDKKISRGLSILLWFFAGYFLLGSICGSLLVFYRLGAGAGDAWDVLLLAIYGVYVPCTIHSIVKTKWLTRWPSQPSKTDKRALGIMIGLPLITLAIPLVIIFAMLQILEPGLPIYVGTELIGFFIPRD